MCMSFSNVQKSFIWNPMYEDHIRKNFENRGNARLRDFLDKARKHNKKLQWLSNEVGKGLQEH